MPSFSGTAGPALPAGPPSGSAAISSGSTLSGVASSAAAAKAAPPMPARLLTPIEKYPKGLPDWFVQKDVHHNGQITMAEYTTNWTAEKVKEFNHYDLNGDGIITAAEVLKVEKSTSGSR
jgi:hypothetical protein